MRHWVAVRVLELQSGLQVQGALGTYLLEGPLGEGGFSHAWAATSADGTPVVLKQLKLGRMGDWKSLELFEREARVLAALSHPNIPRHIELFAHDGAQPHPVSALGQIENASLVSVYVRVEGQSLEQHLARGHVMTGPQLAGMLDQLLAVLEYLHGLQPPVIHRDLKPANVILDPSGVPHLVDFGAIKNHLREGSTSVGTFGYFPMEQMMGQSQPASDLYAAGMTTLVVATGVRPEQMPTDTNTGKVELSKLAPGLPPGVRAALESMLEPIVGRRVQTAAAARALLHNPSTALATPASTALVVPNVVGLQRLANLCIGTAGVGAALLYFVFFNSLSETLLVTVSGLWIAPLVFGIALRVSLQSGSKHPVSTSIAISGAGLLALIVFFIAIFPAL
ncbi:MAG: serine/threonine protein kinase [Nannocystales bacterium]